MALILAASGLHGERHWLGIASRLTLPGEALREATSPDRRARVGVSGADGSIQSRGSSGGDLLAVASGFLESGDEVALKVLDAYAAEGRRGLTRLRGEYAFALWDGRDGTMWVGCDAVGLQAPAYAWDGKALTVSSRAVALVGQSPDWDRAYLAHALAGLWSRTSRATAFRGIHRMRGGDLLRVTSLGVQWLEGPRLALGASSHRNREEAARALGALVDQAVARRASGPRTCIALSGGLDSCVVATSMGKVVHELDAFSLVAPAGTAGTDLALSAMAGALAGMRHHRVEATGELTGPSPPVPLADDPIVAGAAFQEARIALARDAAAAGFRSMLDGEGGDELFDVAWWPRDLARGLAPGALRAVFRSRGSSRRFLRDLALSGSLGPISRILERRIKRRIRAYRPWLRNEFWEGAAFAEAWDESLAGQKLWSAQERLPEVLGAHGRFARAQALVRASFRLTGASPLLDQNVVEFVGSLPAAVVMDPHHGKALLRTLAAQRIAPAIAWRPKNEPLFEWLLQRFVDHDANVAQAFARIDASPILNELVDRSRLAVAVLEARRAPRQPRLARHLVELFGIVEWISHVENRPAGASGAGGAARD